MASFQNTMYAAEHGSDSDNESSFLRYNRNQELNTDIMPEKQREAYNHNLEIIQAANFGDNNFFQNVALEKARQEKKMGVLHVIQTPENLPAKPFFDTFKTKVANIPGAVVETILGHKWEKWQKARQEAINYPKPGKNQKNDISINIEQIEDDKDLVEQINEMSNRANFPKNISITFQKGITSGNPELGDPHKLEVDSAGKIKNYTITINKTTDPKTIRYDIAKKFAHIEPGKFNHIRKLAWYKTWYTVAGALGGALTLGAAAYARENQFSPKTFAIAGGGMVGGALFGAIAANSKKEYIKEQEEYEKIERVAEIYQAKQGMKESLEREAHVIETYKDPHSGVVIEEIEYKASPSTQYPRDRIVAKKWLDHYNKIAATNRYPEIRTRTINSEL